MANFTARELAEMGTLPPRALEAFAECTRERRNILISGIAGAGKTVLLQALLGIVPPDENMLIFEDHDELRLDSPHHKRILLQSGCRLVRESEIIAQALRSYSGRLVIGNLCPPEAGEVLRALGSGRHDGSLLAMSSESPEAALRSLASWRLIDGFHWEAASSEVAKGIHLVMHIAHQGVGCRSITEVAYVESSNSGWLLRPA